MKKKRKKFMDKVTAFVGQMPQKFYQKRMPRAPLVIVAIIFGITGIHLMTGSHAATPYVSINADAGTVANGATKQACSGASNGNCVVFGGPNASVTGASNAVCNPSPCLAGTVPTGTANLVNLGTINNGSADQTRTYGYYIPQNLLHDGSSQGKPAAVFDLSRTSCGTGAANGEYLNSQMGPIADANHFIIIELECTSGTSNWMHPETDCGGAGGVDGAGTCDASTAPSDEPYIKAAVADATTRFNLDPTRRYLIGGSSAANMSRDAICSNSQSPHNSTLFRGIMTMGGGANAKLNTDSGVCPSGDKATFWLELSGKATQADPYNTMNIPNACTTACDHTILGFDATRTWWASYLGNCSAAMHSTTGSGVLSDVYDYTCNDANSTSPFFEAVAVTNGGHMWCGLDSNPAANCGVSPNNTGGWSTAAYTWNFFAHTATN
jgi:poly(3-hydroxybutyrate) depolymerase